MTDSGMFATFLTLALLIPILVFWVVRLMAWALPPPYNWLVRFFLRHPFPMAIAEAVFWLLLLLDSFRWNDASGLDWLLRALLASCVVEALVRVARRARAPRLE